MRFGQDKTSVFGTFSGPCNDSSRVSPQTLDRPFVEERNHPEGRWQSDSEHQFTKTIALTAPPPSHSSLLTSSVPPHCQALSSYVSHVSHVKCQTPVTQCLVVHHGVLHPQRLAPPAYLSCLTTKKAGISHSQAHIPCIRPCRSRPRRTKLHMLCWPSHSCFLVDSSRSGAGGISSTPSWKQWTFACVVLRQSSTMEMHARCQKAPLHHCR